jgi:hypothetical protein
MLATPDTVAPSFLASAIPVIALQGYQLVLEHLPEAEALEDVEKLYDRIVAALLNDPVLARMVTENPGYAEAMSRHQADVDNAEGMPPLALLDLVQSDKQFGMWFAEWNSRIYLVVGPILRDFLDGEAFEAFVRSALRNALTPERIGEIIEGVEELLDEYLVPKHLPAIGAAIEWIIDYLLEEDLPEWIDPVIDGLVEHALTPEQLPVIRSFTTWTLRRLLSPDMTPSQVDTIGDTIIDGARGFADELFQEGDDDEELDVTAAANWLGISPWTLRVHIRKRKGQPNAVPVRLVTGPGIRGRGKHMIRRKDLFEWARTHWFSEKKQHIPPA